MNDVVTGDVLKCSIPGGKFALAVADPMYDYGQDDAALAAVSEACRRAGGWLAPNGTMLCYGWPEDIACLFAGLRGGGWWKSARILQWHYTNKNSPGCRSWQRSHESILELGGGDGTLPNLDAARVPYKDWGNVRRRDGKGRPDSPTKQRGYSKRSMRRYHELGALPRDIIGIPALAGGAAQREGRCHPFQKPIAICTLFVAAYTSPGDAVLDLYSGSGALSLACKAMGRGSLAVELNPVYAETARERLSGLDAEELLRHAWHTVRR